MISSLSDVKPGNLYTTDGEDVWVVESMCHHPTITLKNLRTGQERGGAVGCLNLEPFIPLKPTEPIITREEQLRYAEIAEYNPKAMPLT